MKHISLISQKDRGRSISTAIGLKQAKGKAEERQMTCRAAGKKIERAEFGVSTIYRGAAVDSIADPSRRRVSRYLGYAIYNRDDARGSAACVYVRVYALVRVCVCLCAFTHG